MKINRNKSRGAFTLTELLVVITIIGILSALLLVGINAAMKSARRAAIQLSINGISSSIEELEKTNGAYPPNTSWIVGNTSQRDQLFSDLKRYVKKAYPRSVEPDSLFIALVNVDWSTSPLGPPPGDNTRGMNGAEAIAFWLCHSDDPRYPISGKGGPSYVPVSGKPQAAEPLEDRNFITDINRTQLGPRDANGLFNGRFITYVGPDGRKRRINLWTYRPDGSKQPFVYFDTSRYSVSQLDVPYYGRGSGVSPVYALKQNSNGNLVFANAKKFQILHSGLDDVWGTEFAKIQSEGITFPEGPFTGEAADTQTNFTNGTLQDNEK